ncbi:MAG TPA: biotin--[acetyl-CoA-carboxylase] ligase [Candidatus Blautia ornithocaccae]|nr:biotin--[acetyl-CoA-carboxylase] ligase [Candidatus Blautia ornithocaccae]
MGTKEKLLALFEADKGKFFSGEELAARLAVSRTAVWKAVNSLRKEGYEIQAVRNKGYSLSVSTDILSIQGVEKYLNPEHSYIELEILPDIGSTNDYLREKAAQGKGEGYAVVAGAQTRGKGRTGRSFYSPADTGIYLSLLLRPKDCGPAQAVKFTTMAAVAACEAIEKVSHRSPQIKWVNDIYIDGKKVSGILTEASVSLENGSLEYVLLGIGINVYPPEKGFPQELRETAGSVFQERKSDGKNQLTAGFLNRLMEIYTKEETGEYAEEYRKRSMVLGKRIQILTPEGEKGARALEIDKDCRLLVEYEDGNRELLRAGEIRIRPEK